MREQELEDFLAIHAYLIDPGFAGLRPERQLARKGDRLDLVFCRKAGDAIVELKRGPLDEAAAAQLLRYVAGWSQERRLARTHYLVGRPPRDPDALARALRNAPVPIRVRCLGVHIPARLIYDSHLRRYVAYDDALAANPARYSGELRWDV